MGWYWLDKKVAAECLAKANIDGWHSDSALTLTPPGTTHKA